MSQLEPDIFSLNTQLQILFVSEVDSSDCRRLDYNLLTTLPATLLSVQSSLRELYVSLSLFILIIGSYLQGNILTHLPATLFSHSSNLTLVFVDALNSD